MLLKNAVLAALSVGFSQQAEAQRTSGGSAAAKVKFSKKEYDLDTGVVSFIFEPGTPNEETIEQAFGDLPKEIQVQLGLHGLSQKGGDSYASVKGNVQQAKANLRDILAQLQSGEWRGAGDEARPRLAELAEAISRIKGTDLEKTKVAVEKATDDQRKNWRSNAGVKAMIAKIRAEKAAKALEAAGEQALDIEVGDEQPA